MRFITDFHIHSHYSIATSKNLIPEYLEYWSRIKGIDVLGTGDCAHPGWLNELKEKLEPSGNGLYSLKKEYKLEESKKLAGPYIPDAAHFMLTAEISSIYKKNGKVRKVHNICVFPDFNAAEKLQAQLDQIGNITSDGRPILGLDSKILLEMLLETSDKAFLIPAHIWTPWFSVLGSKSGFDSLEECYEDLTDYIYAVETGLSSDPAMIRTCSSLDRFKMVSNSDAHSPEKLGREANIFNTELSYDGILNSLKGDTGFEGTIEFFPQEGKYHYDGHRKCNVKWDPLETIQHDGICSVCGKPVTCGVMYRVAELADRESPVFQGQEMFYSITQLPEVLAEFAGLKSSKSKKVQAMFMDLIRQCGSEFHVLLFADLSDIAESAGPEMAEGIRRLRCGEVNIEEGFDGEFGEIKVFKGLAGSSNSQTLFKEEPVKSASVCADSKEAYRHSVRFEIGEFQRLLSKKEPATAPVSQGGENRPRVFELSDVQKAAVEFTQGISVILAGPGTGKTRVLVERVRHLIKEKIAAAENMLVLTFSNRACDEIKERMDDLDHSSDIIVSTFHAFGMSILKEHFDTFDREVDFTIIDRDDQIGILKTVTGKSSGLKALLNRIERAKQGIASEDDDSGIIKKYNDLLVKNNQFDLSDLILLPVELLRSKEDVRERYRGRFQWLMVDEFQDVSPLQFEMVQLLMDETSPNLSVIGDPDQSIYGFRGSDPDIMKRFIKDYPEAKVQRLDHSYRCPSPIVTAAGQVLMHQDILSGKDDSVSTEIVETTTERSEAEWIARRIEAELGGVRSFSRDSGMSNGTEKKRDASFSDYAILCRSSFMFPFITKALEDHGIAYQVVGTDPFYSQEPWSTVVSHFRSIYHDTHDIDLPKKVSSACSELITHGDNISECLKAIMDSLKIGDAKQKVLLDLSDHYGSRYDDFLRNLSLRQGTDDYKIGSESLSVMTIHAAKGLEFNTVFIPGCEEGVIPFELFNELDDKGREEEARLLYVGMTRAKEQLILSYSKKREYKGRVLKGKRSAFIDLIKDELLNKEKQKELGKDLTSRNQLELF